MNCQVLYSTETERKVVHVVSRFLRFKHFVLSILLLQFVCYGTECCGLSYVDCAL